MTMLNKKLTLISSPKANWYRSSIVTTRASHALDLTEIIAYHAGKILI